MLAKKCRAAVFWSFLFLFLAVPHKAEAARLFLSPGSGNFTVDSVFDVSVFLDTENQTVNALEIFLKFPPDKLQVSSSVIGGRSVIGVWTGPPEYDNSKGTLELRGGIPKGLNASQGLIAKVSFRVKQVGTAAIQFGNESRVLLNDGKGTDVLRDTPRAVFDFSLPPPLGPSVVSETHPNQTHWYPIDEAVLHWEGDVGADGYSYILNDSPIDIPDNIREGDNQRVAYKHLSDGTHYFHIKAHRGGVWGGITHYAINVDKEPPAIFPIIITPGQRTTSKNPVIFFETTDAHSGIDHYEYKVVHLNPSPEPESPFFVETTGQKILELPLGSYDVIARAYDKAGNYREVTERLNIVLPLFQFISEKGLSILGIVNIPWFWLFAIGLLAVLFLGHLGIRVRSWHHGLILKSGSKELPSVVKEKLAELKRYRQKYGKALSCFLILAAFSLGCNVAYAQHRELSPPFISTVSRNISNEEIFYAGGKTDAAGIDVVLYLQNLQSGETWSEVVTSDRKNEWFYRHDTFLSSGNYLLWAQTKIGDELSPPSPQITMTVRQTALQFGASRLSFEIIYLILALLLLIVVLGFIAHLIFHAYHGRKKHLAFMKEVKEAEESVRRGFAVLKRDIQAELSVVHKMKLSKALSEEEHNYEEQLLKDLEQAEQYIGKEVWDVEHAGQYD